MCALFSPEIVQAGAVKGLNRHVRQFVLLTLSILIPLASIHPIMYEVMLHLAIVKHQLTYLAIDIHSASVLALQKVITAAP